MRRVLTTATGHASLHGSGEASSAVARGPLGAGTAVAPGGPHGACEQNVGCSGDVGRAGGHRAVQRGRAWPAWEAGEGWSVVGDRVMHSFLVVCDGRLAAPDSAVKKQ